jgi:hypothetical protein
MGHLSLSKWVLFTTTSFMLLHGRASVEALASTQKSSRPKRSQEPEQRRRESLNVGRNPLLSLNLNYSGQSIFHAAAGFEETRNKTRRNQFVSKFENWFKRAFGQRMSFYSKFPGSYINSAMVVHMFLPLSLATGLSVVLLNRQQLCCSNNCVNGIINTQICFQSWSKFLE